MVVMFEVIVMELVVALVNISNDADDIRDGGDSGDACDDGDGGDGDGDGKDGGIDDDHYIFFSKGDEDNEVAIEIVYYINPRKLREFWEKR